MDGAGGGESCAGKEGGPMASDRNPLTSPSVPQNRPECRMPMWVPARL